MSEMICLVLSAILAIYFNVQPAFGQLGNSCTKNLDCTKDDRFVCETFGAFVDPPCPGSCQCNPPRSIFDTVKNDCVFAKNLGDACNSLSSDMSYYPSGMTCSGLSVVSCQSGYTKSGSTCIQTTATLLGYGVGCTSGSGSAICDVTKSLICDSTNTCTCARGTIYRSARGGSCSPRTYGDPCLKDADCMTGVYSYNNDAVSCNPSYQTCGCQSNVYANSRYTDFVPQPAMRTGYSVQIIDRTVCMKYVNGSLVPAGNYCSSWQGNSGLSGPSACIGGLVCFQCPGENAPKCRHPSSDASRATIASVALIINLAALLTY